MSNRYMLYRQSVNMPGKHAGDWWIMDGESGKDVAGPFPSYSRWLAENKRAELEEADIPNIFSDLFSNED